MQSPDRPDRSAQARAPRFTVAGRAALMRGCGQVSQHGSEAYGDPRPRAGIEASKPVATARKSSKFKVEDLVKAKRIASRMGSVDKAVAVLLALKDFGASGGGRGRTSRCIFQPTEFVW
jgi:hypothetical protein